MIVGFQYREKKLCSVRCAHLQLFFAKKSINQKYLHK